MGLSQMRVWSTSDVAEREFLSYWRDAVCDAFLKVRTEHESPRDFRGRIASGALGPILVNDVQSTSHLVRRDRGGIARDPDAAFFLNLHRAGACALTQAGREHMPSAGDFSLHEGTRPFALGFRGDMALTCFVIPHATMLARCPGAIDAVAKPLPATPAAALFRGYARALAEEARRLTAAEAAAAGDSLVDLLGLALDSGEHGREAARPAARAALFQTVKRLIRARSADPDFDLNAAAGLAGMAARTLQSLLQRHETSFSQLLIETRLEQADRLLATRPDLPISAIAYGVGFSDLSHFSRTYRKTHGVSASERRRTVGGRTTAAPGRSGA